MSLASKLLSASGGADVLFSPDVFSTFIYTGNGATQTINNGIDLAGKGGLVWIKHRTSATSNVLIDTVRGIGTYLSSDLTSPQTAATFLNSFDSNGFTLATPPGAGSLTPKTGANSLSAPYVSWTFRKSPKFFDVVTYTGDGVAGRQIAHALGIAPGMVTTKSTSVAGDWNTYHQNATGDLVFNSAAQTASKAIVPAASATTFTVSGIANTSGTTYVAYLFAPVTGISKLGSFTGNGTSQTIDCGFTTGARFVMIKATSATGDWMVADSARGLVAANDPRLSLNTTAAEVTTEDWLDPDPSGFIVNQVSGSSANASGVSYIFLSFA